MVSPAKSTRAKPTSTRTAKSTRARPSEHARRIDEPTGVKVGDVVRFPFGGYPLLADVIEIRGNLGVGGREIIRIMPRHEYLDEPWEMPTEEVELVEDIPAAEAEREAALWAPRPRRKR